MRDCLELQVIWEEKEENAQETSRVNNSTHDWSWLYWVGSCFFIPQLLSMRYLLLCVWKWFFYRSWGGVWHLCLQIGVSFKAGIYVLPYMLLSTFSSLRVLSVPLNAWIVCYTLLVWITLQLQSVLWKYWVVVRTVQGMPFFWMSSLQRWWIERDVGKVLMMMTRPLASLHLTSRIGLSTLAWGVST